jgi:hypothetical protein
MVVALDVVANWTVFGYRTVNLPIVKLRLWQTLFGLHRHIQDACC